MSFANGEMRRHFKDEAGGRWGLIQNLELELRRYIIKLSGTIIEEISLAFGLPPSW